MMVSEYHWGRWLVALSLSIDNGKMVCSKWNVHIESTKKGNDCFTIFPNMQVFHQIFVTFMLFISDS